LDESHGGWDGFSLGDVGENVEAVECRLDVLVAEFTHHRPRIGGLDESSFIYAIKRPAEIGGIQFLKSCGCPPTPTGVGEAS
jgi:hypothetical protein